MKRKTLKYPERCILEECCEEFVPLAQCETLWYTPDLEKLLCSFAVRTKIVDLGLSGLVHELTNMRKKGSEYWRTKAAKGGS
jgi:hypothetical protein